jgi:hypothetical protein
MMDGRKLRIGEQEHVVISFRQHRPGGADSCLVHLSLRTAALRASEESWVLKSDLARFVASIQNIFESLAGEAGLPHESGLEWLSVNVGRRGQMKVRVQLAGCQERQPDNSAWRLHSEFFFYPQGNLRFISTAGLDVKRQYIED